MTDVAAMLADLDGRSMVLAEGRVDSDATIADSMIEIDFVLSTTGEEVIVEQLIVVGAVFRLPKEGEVALLGFVDGDRNEGYVLGWISRPGAPLVAGEVSAGALYIFPQSGERVAIVVDEGQEIRAGSDSADLLAVALAPKVAQALEARGSVYSSHTHIHPLPLIPVGAAPTAPPLPSTLPNPDVAASKLKAE